MTAFAPLHFGKDGTAMNRRKYQAMLHEAFEPFVQFVPRTADSVSLTASCLEDDLKRFPLVAALTITRS